MGKDEMNHVSAKRGFPSLWWLAIGGVVLIACSMAVAWQSIPNPMAVQWSTDGNIANTMPKLGWAAVWSGAWVLASSGLVALRAPYDWRRALLIVLLGILVVGYVMTLLNNLGAATWREAESLNLLSAALWAVIAAAAVWVADRLLDRWSDVR